MIVAIFFSARGDVENAGDDDRARAEAAELTCLKKR